MGRYAQAAEIMHLSRPELLARPLLLHWSTNRRRGGLAYRTFTASLEDVRRAASRSLKRMDMRVRTDRATDSGRSIVALASERTVTIELERLTARTTRMRVTAKHGAIFRDRATAGEIVAQTERALDELPAVSQRAH